MPALILLIIAIPTIQVIFRTQGAAAPSHALTVTVRGWQWWWEFRYPSLDVVTANELHLPVGRPVVFALEGPDVIHSFWVPQLGGKRDVVPGRLNRITLTPERVGEYWGQCAEFCGVSHANMGLRVIVEEPAAFDRWVAAQKAAPPEPEGAAAEGKALYTRSACVGCHAIRGVSAGALGPDLTHFGSRARFGAGLWPNTGEHVVAWLKDPPALKPGVEDAEPRPERRRGQGAGRLPGEPEVMATRDGRAGPRPRPRPRARRHRSLELAHDGRSQAHRHPLRRVGLRVLPHRRDRGADHPAAAGPARTARWCRRRRSTRCSRCTAPPWCSWRSCRSARPSSTTWSRS